MSKLTDFLDAQTAFNTELTSDLTAIAASIADLNAKITDLQNSAGTLSPEDQARIDAIQAAGTALVGQADALAGKTPPAPPAA